MAKFLEILHRDSILALFYIANILFYLGGLYDSRIPLVNFLLDTRYQFHPWIQLKNNSQQRPEGLKIRAFWGQAEVRRSNSLEII